jgi:hypothetical protein
MEEYRKPEESPDDSLADVPPMPVPRPIPFSLGPALDAALLTVAGTGAFLLVASMTTPTLGATRSSKLVWQERQRQIEQAERDARPSKSE